MFDEGQTNANEEQVTEDVTPEVTEETKQPEEEQWFVVNDRKYDKEAAATKIQHADTHIGKLESELAELRKQLELTTAQQKVKETMEASTTKQNQQGNESAPVQNTTDTTQAVKPEDLLSQVESILAQREQEKSKSSNLSTSTELARSTYGDSYQQKLQEIGNELGLSKADIVEMASTKPQAFTRLFGLQSNAPKPRPSSVSTLTVGNHPQQEDASRSAAKVVLSSKSAKERNEAVAALLATAKR